jgi:hypothetical protein
MDLSATKVKLVKQLAKNLLSNHELMQWRAIFWFAGRIKNNISPWSHTLITNYNLKLPF